MYKFVYSNLSNRFSTWFFSFLLLVIGMGNKLHAQESKILITQTACVDIAEILNAVDQSYLIQDYLLGAEKIYREKFQDVENKIQELYNYLYENEGSLTESEIEEINKEIEYQKLELDETQPSNNQSNEEIILKGIYQVIKEIAEQDGLSIIIEKSSAVIYNNPEVDITDKVIKTMTIQSTPAEGELE